MPGEKFITHSPNPKGYKVGEIGPRMPDAGELYTSFDAGRDFFGDLIEHPEADSPYKVNEGVPQVPEAQYYLDRLESVYEEAGGKKVDEVDAAIREHDLDSDNDKELAALHDQLEEKKQLFAENYWRIAPGIGSGGSLDSNDLVEHENKVQEAADTGTPEGYTQQQVDEANRFIEWFRDKRTAANEEIQNVGRNKLQVPRLRQELARMTIEWRNFGGETIMRLQDALETIKPEDAIRLRTQTEHALEEAKVEFYKRAMDAGGYKTWDDKTGEGTDHRSQEESERILGPLSTSDNQWGRGDDQYIMTDEQLLGSSRTIRRHIEAASRRSLRMLTYDILAKPRNWKKKFFRDRARDGVRDLEERLAQSTDAGEHRKLSDKLTVKREKYSRLDEKYEKRLDKVDGRREQIKNIYVDKHKDAVKAQKLAKAREAARKALIQSGVKEPEVEQRLNQMRPEIRRQLWDVALKAEASKRLESLAENRHHRSELNTPRLEEDLSKLLQAGDRERKVLANAEREVKLWSDVDRRARQAMEVSRAAFNRASEEDPKRPVLMSRANTARLSYEYAHNVRLPQATEMRDRIKGEVEELEHSYGQAKINTEEERVKLEENEAEMAHSRDRARYYDQRLKRLIQNRETTK